MLLFRERGTEGGATVAALLNDAWRDYWRGDGRAFRDLEKMLISRLAVMSRGGGAPR